MEVSKLTIKKQGESKMMKMLRFIHATSCKDPNFLKDTNVRNIAKRYSLTEEESINNTLSLLNRLINNNIITVNYLIRGPHPRANIRINYLHPSIPDDMRESMPEEAKEYIKRIQANLDKAKTVSPDAHIEEDDVVVTPPAHEETSVPVEVHKDGRSISITITLNLNM